MRYLMVLLLSLLLVSCAGPTQSGPGLEPTLNQFREAMRWKDYPNAAKYLREDVRGEFLDVFREDEDLHVVESRIVSVELSPDGESAEIDYRLKFYLLPSSRVRELQWTQLWQLQQKKALRSGIWQIVSAPPALP